ncbi:MAG: hypothetical protein PHQ19_09590 [Candidatus Krumholzibacteria bacterium]|nr:hypothetical protein [Candidatus Krumholzibacteria bacterium]
MNRILSVLLVLGLIPSFFFGCSGDDGASGPVGPAGSPQPIKVLFAGADTEDGLKNFIAAAHAYGGFPMGSELEYFSIQSASPTLATLKEYDVVVVYTWYTSSAAAAVGNVLADYVDGGGKVVMLQATFSGTYALAGGRIMTGGYSPLQPAAAAGVAGNRSISQASLSYPLHPIFNGTDVRNLVFWSNANVSNPTLDPTATLIALDSAGANAIAINAEGNVMAFGVCGSTTAWDVATFPYAGILIANACLFLTGAF